MINMATTDFNQMQAQAIRRAKEMQRRATPPIYQEPSPEPKKEPKSQKQAYPRPKEVFTHNTWTQTQQTPFCNNACPIKNILSPPGNCADNDVMLLMALMLLLTADGGDKMLLFALLYIMT